MIAIFDVTPIQSRVPRQIADGLQNSMPDILLLFRCQSVLWGRSYRDCQSATLCDGYVAPAVVI